jgi:hypothetical protein
VPRLFTFAVGTVGNVPIALARLRPLMAKALFVLKSISRQKVAPRRLKSRNQPSLFLAFAFSELNRY